MSILITGGTGFVGLALAEHLTQAGERVVLFGLPVAPSIAHRFASQFPTVATCRVVEGDVRDRAEVDAALDAAPPDDPIHCVIHAAAVTPSPQREHDDAAGVASVNIIGTVNVVEAVAARPHIRGLVVLSSVAVYGNPPAAASGYIEEDLCPPQPSALYGITKLSVELLVQRLALVHGLRAAIVRVGPVYGPWEHATGVRDILSPPQQVLDAALAASELEQGREQARRRAVVLPANAPADFIYARDAAAGIAAIADATRKASQAGTSIFNLAGGMRVDLSQWCEALQPLIPTFPWHVAVGDEAATIVHMVPKGRAPLSMEKVRTQVGFVPRFDLASAAKDYLAWLDAGLASDKERAVPKQTKCDAAINAKITDNTEDKPL